MTERDEFDPADWLASQFGEEPPPRTPSSRGLPRGAVVPPAPPPPPASGPPAETPAPPGWSPPPAAPSYDIPTQAFAYPASPDLPGQLPLDQVPLDHVQPGQSLAPAWQPEPVWQPEPSAGSWFSTPIDPALEGLTDVVEAELVGPTAPPGEGPEAQAIDVLFGDSRFKDFSDEPFIAPLAPRQPGGATAVASAPKPARASIPRNQKILMWIAGGLIAALALVALFGLGTKLSGAVAPRPVLPTPSPTAPVAPVVAIGPVAPGEHRWDELLGGECISPYQSAWQDSYIVVACATPHPAQMVFRGKFADPVSATYPGIDELQKRVPALCGAPTVINYAVAGGATDIQLTASFAADAADWNTGNRTFYCFATRAAGATFASSIAIPQKPATPTPAPSPST